MSSPAPVFDLEDMQFSPTAWLFEGAKRGGAGVSMFIVRTPPGGGVDLHVHPYPETFILLEGMAAANRRLAASSLRARAEHCALRCVLARLGFRSPSSRGGSVG